MVIHYNSKMYPYDWLSNLYPSPMLIRLKYISDSPILVPSVEAGFQLNKLNHPDVQGMFDEERVRKILNLDPYKAKHFGSAKSGCPLRPDFDDVKVDIMTRLIDIKYRNPVLRSMLDATGEAQLIELANWDTFWGVNDDGEGQNMSGRITMSVRTNKPTPTRKPMVRK